jgi:type II secretory pathway component PulM
MNLTLLSTWWNRRNKQEKIVLKVGFYFVVFIVFYYIFALGFGTALDMAEEKWNTNQALLEWMQPRVEFLKEQQARQPIPISDTLMLSSIEQSIAQSSFSQALVKLTETQNTAVEVQLKAVNFNQLLLWLGEQNTKNGLITVQMMATATENAGIVDVTFILDNSLLR